MKCKYCGNEFEQKKRGRKEYCDKPECIRKARNETQRKWYAKKNKKIVEIQNTETVVYST